MILYVRRIKESEKYIPDTTMESIGPYIVDVPPDWNCRQDVKEHCRESPWQEETDKEEDEQWYEEENESLPPYNGLYPNL
ncbi:hypothetical protein L596_009830 [Steinernema carpocapsae]|uniref:Uncharacterized protein n=1 Tax=Steinernema carpocapsae TaxID=34508 RepID=A0A4U5PGQ1_STECR|nr:hypothetical protein L596_009830 [Steinernema carpocapsae]